MSLMVINSLKLCPFCKDPLKNSFKEWDQTWEKVCENKLSHFFYLRYFEHDKNTDSVCRISIKFKGSKNGFAAVWKIENGQPVLDIYSLDFSKNSYLPYFEPDLSDCDKLFKKIRTYLTFS